MWDPPNGKSSSSSRATDNHIRSLSTFVLQKVESCAVSLNLKDDETVALVTEVARRLGRTKTAAVRELAREKLAELDAEGDDEAERRYQALRGFVAREIRPLVKPGARITKDEIEQLLGYDEMFPEK